MSTFDELKKKIEAQQKKEKEGSPAIMVGMQLLDMAEADPRAAELLNHDLDVAEMSLAKAADQIKAYADKNHKGTCFCVTPIKAEEILRTFYGLPAAGKAAPVKDPGILSLDDFL